MKYHKIIILLVIFAMAVFAGCEKEPQPNNQPVENPTIIENNSAKPQDNISPPDNNTETTPEPEKIPENVTIKIINTTDLHGSFMPWDFIENKATSNSLAHVYTYVKNQRNQENTETVLIDCGDNLQGQPVVYYHNFEKTDTMHSFAEVTNYMNYDAIIVGNHDIETGHKVYDKIAKEYKCPLLTANAVRTTDKKPYFTPYTIVNKAGVKIAILGLTTLCIPFTLPPNMYSGMEFQDLTASAKYWLEQIKTKVNPDLIVVAAHEGWKPIERKIAKLLSGIDVILCGHDHQRYIKTYEKNDGKSTLLMDSGNACEVIGVCSVEMKFNKETKKWSKIAARADFTKPRNFEADPDFMQKFTPAIEEVKNYVSRKVCEITENLYSRDAFFGDSKFVDIVHSVQLELTGADISISAPLSIDKTVEKGDIFVSDMFKLYKYENLLYTMRFTGQEIKDYLEYSHGNWFNQMKDENDHLINFKKDKNGELIYNKSFHSYETNVVYYRNDCAAGINYTFDLSKPKGKQVSIISMADGTAFDLAKDYKVAVNSYRGTSRDLRTGMKISEDDQRNRILTSTDKDLRFYMMRWLEKKAKFTPICDNNWKLIPETWATKAKAKDSTLLFPSK